MKRLAILAVTLAIVLAWQSAGGAGAQGLQLAASYPASYYRLKTLKFDVPTCLHLSEQAVKKTKVSGVNVFNIKKGATFVGGHTLETRGYIVCVRLPKDGACKGDGSTAVIVGAGPKAKLMAKNLAINLNDIASKYTLIDCG